MFVGITISSVDSVLDTVASFFKMSSLKGLVSNFGTIGLNVCVDKVGNCNSFLEPWHWFFISIFACSVLLFSLPIILYIWFKKFMNQRSWFST